ncbi:Aldolase-type TIM barrel [Pleurostoma richardsiae]|uniref:Aldolase-type TIM barrel n=1 Tax=Pleurostoma richardsiae TaxID=41990 RepID=A0AA38RR68_9PEZI|nr:Aldolase-type TIM barrel [Pleurostoma richardsiae]
MPVCPPCRRCSKKGISCTFEEGPGPRKRPSRPGSGRADGGQSQSGWSEEGNALTFSPLSHALFFEHHAGTGIHDNFASDPGPFALETFGAFHDPFGTVPEPPEALSAPRTSSSSSTGSVASPLVQDVQHSQTAQQTRAESLEFLPGAFSFYIGPTGVSDVYLLSREAYDERNVTKPRVSGLKYRRLGRPAISEDKVVDQPTLFGITDKNLIERAEPRLDSQEVDNAWTELWKLLSPAAAWNLIQLYARFVDPYFPVLSRHQIPDSPDELSNMSLALLTAICATALPFLMYDEKLVHLLLHPPSSEQLYRLCWLGLSQELHAPSLTTVQAGLLLLQRLPTNYYLSDTAFTWSLISSTLAAGQTIGLHRDPSTWNSVPLWERRLRRRLWWSLWTMEKWIAVARGMPSHLHDEDYDVLDLRPDDIDDSLSDAPQTKSHFYYLTTLTAILCDVRETYYTVRGSRRTSADLPYSLDAARPIRVRLKDWRDQLPSTLKFNTSKEAHSSSRMGFGEQDLDGNASVHLSYIVTHMSLFRALLRPLSSSHQRQQSTALLDGATAVTRGALLCVREFVEFVETLTDVQWNAFWHSWSRAGFAMAGSFMVHLLHVVSRPGRTGGDGFSEERAELQGLVKRWRWANRVAANGAAGMKGLTNLGLLRVETLLNNFAEMEA